MSREEHIPRTIIEAAHLKRNQIEQLVTAYYERSLKIHEENIEKAKRMIIPLEKIRKTSESLKLPHAAEDGGSDTLDLEAFTIYAVQAWAGSWVPGREGYTLNKEYKIADVGVVHPAGKEEERVRIYRETLEAWAAYNTIQEIMNGYILWDGSITTLLAGRRPWTGTQYRLQQITSQALNKLGFPDLEELIDWILKLQSSHPLRVIEEVSPMGSSSDDLYWISFTEWVNKLVSIRRLLEKSIQNRTRPVFITKTTRSQSLINGTLPDIYYLRKAKPYEPFMTTPRIRTGVIEAGKEFSQEFFPGTLGIYFQEELTVLSFYTRLDPGAQILRIEAVYPISEISPLDVDKGMEEAEKIVEWLLSLPRSRGYPIVLNLSHKNSHISRRDLLHALTILGFSLDRSGRSMLGE